jgi:hypothetical protein
MTHLEVARTGLEKAFLQLIYQLAQLSWHTVRAQTGSIGDAWLWLILYAVVFLGLAIFASRADEQLSFG